MVEHAVQYRSDGKSAMVAHLAVVPVGTLGNETLSKAASASLRKALKRAYVCSRRIRNVLQYGSSTPAVQHDCLPSSLTVHHRCSVSRLLFL